MRLGGPVGLMCCLLLSGAEMLRAEENPEALIDRAIEAQGGEAKLAQLQAAAVKIKGSAFVGDMPIPFTGEAFYQSPDRYRQALHVTMGDQTMTQTLVCNGNKAWIRLEDNTLDLSDDIRAELRKGRYVERVAGLILLKKGGYQLSLTGTAKVKDKEADVVKVTSPGQPEVRLFLDKATGLLVKTEHRQLDPQQLIAGAKVEIVQESFYSEYRAVDSAELDEKTLHAGKVPVDVPGLLEFFRAKIKVDRERIVTLVRQLGDNSFPVREKAGQELVALGESTVPFLKQALKSADPEVVRRAERCLQMILPDPAKKERERAIQAAAVRLLAAKKPAGTTETLLTFLPLATDEAVEREIRAALAALAMRDGKPDQTLVEALECKDPLRQSAAAEALGKIPLPPGRKISIDGVKRPIKAAIYRDGKLNMKWEVLEVTYFNRLDDKLFAKP